MIYLASPYSHPRESIRERRFRDACLATAKLLRTGHSVFSPIVHGHPLVHHGLPTDWSFWEPFDRDHISRCDEVLVLMLEGWKSSTGVAAEILIARELGIPVRYLAQDATVSPTLAHVATEAGS
jgi:hypothetical protein